MHGYLCSPHLEIEISVDEFVDGGPALFPSQASLVPKPVHELQMGAKAATQQQYSPEQLVTLQLDMQHQQSLAETFAATLAVKQARLAELASRKIAAEVILAAAAAKKAKDVQASGHSAPEQAMADRAQATHIPAAAQVKVRADAKKANANAQTQAMAKAEAETSKVEAAVHARAQAETCDPEAQEAAPDDVRAAAFKAQWARPRRPC